MLPSIARARVMANIANTLNLPFDFFLRAPDESAAGMVFYRSMSSAAKALSFECREAIRMAPDGRRLSTAIRSVPDRSIPDV